MAVWAFIICKYIPLLNKTKLRATKKDELYVLCTYYMLSTVKKKKQNLKSEVKVKLIHAKQLKDNLEKGAPSRWQRSKGWRSPSSPQIHQNYIYTCNNSDRTPTECWQKT